MSELKFGRIKSPDDHRDWMYRSIVARTTQLPSKHLPDRVPIRDQGDYGTCVGFAGAYIKYLQERANHPGKNYIFSPAYLYSECKKIDGMPNVEGTTLRAAYQVMSKQGICQEKIMPYSQMGSVLPQATQEAHNDGKRFLIDKAYARLMSLDDLKQAILKTPIMGGVIVTESFLEPENGHILPVPAGYILGGHALCIDGYDDDRVYTYKNGITCKGFFRSPNSWDIYWGDDGYGWIPYDYYHFRSDIGMRFFDEAWTGLDVIMPHTYAQKVELWLNSTRAVIDSEEIQLEQPPTLEQGTERTLLPVRFLSEVFGYKVDWNAAEKKITITKQEV